MPLPPLPPHRKASTTELARKVLTLYNAVRQDLPEGTTVQGYRATQELIAVAVELARAVIAETAN